jgi:anti-sigma B factor antagonist
MPDAPLSYAAESGREPGTTIVRLAGPLTLSNMFAFQSYLRSLDAPVLLFDMSGVNYMDSAGLGLLTNGHVSAKNAGRRFVLCGVNERVLALIEMTKLDSILNLSPSVEAAENAHEFWQQKNSSS